jgi:UPF0755 protein
MPGRKISRKAHPAVRISMWIIFLAMIAGLVFLVKVYRMIFSPSVIMDGKEESYFYIRTGDPYEVVVMNLLDQGIVKDRTAFEWLAKKKKYPSNIHPGRYMITKGMTNNELLNMLRSGDQTPLMLMFNNIRTLKQLAGVISRQLEPDSSEFLKVFSDPESIARFGFNEYTFPAMFIPNSYQFYWNTSVKKFVERMHSEYLVFWAKGRSDKAEKIGMSLTEVSTLASIVDQESLHNEENERIAGVFMNRIKAGIPLQSDPTVIFAWQDFNIRRVLNKHKKIDSPYNTYKYKDLPPGPICIPSIHSIDAVLNFEANEYLYFCAREDFSGYHYFARTLSQHNHYAGLYRKALNRKRIYN